MSDVPIDYLQLTREGLRSVIVRAMSHVCENGFHGEQHFFIVFETSRAGVVMPDWLRAQYPEEIGIVLQHEYYDFAVMNDRFSVTLSFADRAATLVVPFVAVKSFADPSVNFRIEIPLPDSDSEVVLSDMPLPAETNLPSVAADQATDADDAPDTERGTVVSLDAFRKK